MEIQWDAVLPPLTVIGALLLMWWRLDSKIESVRKSLESKIQGVSTSLDTKIEGVSTSLDAKIEDVRESLDSKIEGVGSSLDTKIEGVRKASEDAHASIRDDLCDLKVSAATTQNDVEWIKKELARD